MLPGNPGRIWQIAKGGLIVAGHIVTFLGRRAVEVPTGTLVSEAAHLAGVDIQQPCGGQGRCGRCAVQIKQGTVRRRSTLRLSAEDIEAGFALACQSVVEADVSLAVPEQEKIERLLTTDRTAAKVEVPAGYDPHLQQSVRRVPLTLTPPSMDDQTDDWSRLQSVLRREKCCAEATISLMQLRRVGHILRKGDWKITLILDADAWDCPDCPVRLIDFKPGHVPDDAPLWGVAIDIGTTTVSLWLVDLITGEVHVQVAEYNGQIARGEDVISRIIYAGRGDGAEELRNRVLETINGLVERACKRVQTKNTEIVKATIAGNSTMMHLLLGIPAASIRLTPFITAVNHIPSMTAAEVGVDIHPDATVDCLPGVASYVGADISAGVLSSGVADTDLVTIFIDVGTNGEIVLGNKEWLVTAACSAGPAFEGGGVLHGMRATRGAIEEIWVNTETYEPTYRVIGNVKPRGICGSGLISLMAEMFLTGVVDKGGHVNLDLDTPRVRTGEHGPEYVLAWANESATKKDIVITNVDIDNLLRAKAAIYAGFTVLAQSVGVPLETAEQVLVGGSFGKYINVEKAVEIGLLPDMDWDRFKFLGNTSVRGAYLALLDSDARARITDIANRMTYIELSADNTFYDAFTSALFLPHTDMARFPTVAAAMAGNE
jgi:uncharacterized 2Fe-2S/4Fe-4S cluster protein (DUF4445 family)